MTHQPIQIAQRTKVVDVLRGFALAGVLIANLASFIVFASPHDVQTVLISTSLDQVHSFLLSVFIDNRFITLFSLFFGYGFGVIMERLAMKPIHSVRFFTWRMLLLLLAGLIHLAIWWGEILHSYALCGFFLLFFRKSSNRTLLISSIFFILVPTTLIRFLQIYLKVIDTEILNQVLTSYHEGLLHTDLLKFLSGNARFYDYIFVSGLVEWRDGFEILGKFLLGYYVMRRGILMDITSNIGLVQKATWICFAIAVLFMGEMMFFYFHPDFKIEQLPVRLTVFALNRVGILSNSIFYAGLIVLLYQRWPGNRILSGFRYVGMMSLTNYLTHTLLYIFIFYGWGLGLADTLHLKYTVPVGMSIYLVQVFFSRWWMKRFSYGPAEWIWRQLSYRKKLPIKRV